MTALRTIQKQQNRVEPLDIQRLIHPAMAAVLRELFQGLITV